MKKIWILWGLLVLTPFVFAQEDIHHLEIAYEVSNYRYKEPGVMKIKSQPKQGISAVYTRRNVLSIDSVDDEQTFATIDFRYMTGDAKYIGARMDGTPFSASGIDDYYFEAGFRAGVIYEMSENLELWPYIGLGWRKLVNHLEEAGEGGYLRKSTYWYLPLGLNFKYNAENGWNFSLNGEFDWLLKGSQYSGEIMGVLDSNTNEQKEGYGVRVGLKAEKDLGKVGLFVEPFWRYWHIQNSEQAYKEIIGTGLGLTGFYEPKNNTHEYGLKIGIAF